VALGVLAAPGWPESNDTISSLRGNSPANSRIVDTLISKGAAADNDSFRLQILKSSSKPPAQIAEGFARYLPRDSANYYRMARASLAETRTHLQRGFHRRYWGEADQKKALELAEGAFKTTGGLLASRLRLIKEEERRTAEKKRRRPRQPELPKPTP